MVRYFAYTPDFGQLATFLMDSLHYNFCLAPGGKSTRPGEFHFFYIFSLKSLNLLLIPGTKLDSHQSTWTGYSIIENDKTSLRK